MHVAPQSGTGGRRATVARADAAFPWYIGAAFVLAVAGGFVLALLLPVAVILEWDWGIRWRVLAQAHGHLQIVGWLGLFIAGMAFRLAPRFAGRPLWLSGLTGLALVLLLFGVLGRVVSQPLLDDPAMRGVLFVSVVAEAAGAVLVAVSLIVTLAPSMRTLVPAPFLMLGATGMAAQALLGLLWLPDLTAEAPMVAPDRNDRLLAVQFYAFVLPFILGVSLRALPTFFARPAPRVSINWMLALLLGLGAAAYAAGPMAVDGSDGIRIGAAGALLIAAAIAGVIAQTGVWSQPERLRASARHAALLVRTAYAWLALVALALAFTGGRSLLNGEPTPFAETDAIRHALALGVFTTLLAGMAYLMLPWLAMRRIKPAAARRETRLLWVLLTAAAALRVAGALLQDAGTDRYRLMAVAGVLGIVAIAFFASIVLRSAVREAPEFLLEERKPA